MDDFTTVLAKAGNFLSAFAIVGTMVGWFPYFAAFVGFCYYLIQIYESRTVQHWIDRRRKKRIAAFHARIMILEEAIKQAKLDKEDKP